ncbi:tRNA pseudouridine(55) synthase TruB [Sphingomonas sp. RB56-2]|uniref:tRNA pseudouridine synthase B n=1 Tax=Sphingomonas brevis TaxID=2908206 RepID=A0ABT0S9X0_9SPHN|nr:tRNA pseudouridine(55) synthase TruB [Sphingomonas brevis]MCL6740939.1 tRNA pseudouridine(55) synthase TruB [Sphingomonas brevis]
MALSGWIILDKPVGTGSTQAVGAVKRVLREAGEPKTKVGHGGTLDPLASGVLPIALGEATKLAGRMLDATKAYDFTIRFGEETDTLDLEGQVIAASDVRPSRADIEAILPRFTGLIEQVPPAFSALKVDGQRAYDLAREGKEVELKSRAVTVHSLKIHHPHASGDPGNQEENPGSRFRGNDESMEDITLSATVSKGTYIRSLARDIAHALNSVGHVTMLRRTKAGPFTLEQAISLDKLAEIAKGRALTRTVLPLEAGLDDIPGLPVTPEQARLLRHGQQLFGIPATPGLSLAMDGAVPVALVEGDGTTIKVVRGFNL